MLAAIEHTCVWAEVSCFWNSWGVREVCLLCVASGLQRTAFDQGLRQAQGIRLAARTIERASDRAAERATERLSDRATERLSDRATERPGDRATERRSDRATERPSDWATERPSDRATERPSDRATEQPSDQATERPCERQINCFPSFCRPQGPTKTASRIFPKFSPSNSILSLQRALVLRGS